MKFRIAALLVALVLLLGLVGHFDYQDQEAEEAQYCDMVKAKLWPDYKGIYRQSCKGK
jgi:hypothetical protein